MEGRGFLKPHMQTEVESSSFGDIDEVNNKSDLNDDLRQMVSKHAAAFAMELLHRQIAA